MPDLGPVNFNQFTAGSHDWATGMNYNLLKAATLMKGAAISATTALPGSAAQMATYIDPATGLINVMFGGAWNTITPSDRLLFFVIDENQFRQWSDDNNSWLTLPNSLPGAVPRELGFYAPGLVRNNAVLFRYICGQEITLPAGLAGSVARLEEANDVDLVLDMNGGTITFLAGSTVGVFSFPSEVVLQPTLVESQYSTASVLTISSRDVGTILAKGLQITLRGAVRPIAEG